MKGYKGLRWLPIRAYAPQSCWEDIRSVISRRLRVQGFLGLAVYHLCSLLAGQRVFDAGTACDQGQAATNPVLAFRQTTTAQYS